MHVVHLFVGSAGESAAWATLVARESLRGVRAAATQCIEKLEVLQRVDPAVLPRLLVRIAAIHLEHTRDIARRGVIPVFPELLRHLPGKLLVVWDGLPQHRARLVTEFISEQRGRLAIERLPAYAPELNPLEYLWGY